MGAKPVIKLGRTLFWRIIPFIVQNADKKGYDYLLPIFTFGQYYEDGGKYYIPLSIQVHHAVCDGFHVCRFLDELQDLLNK